MSILEQSRHRPVLVNEVIALLNEHKGDRAFTMFDGTFGGGGHTKAILENFRSGKIYAVDRDKIAINRGLEKIKPCFNDRLHLTHCSFRDGFLNTDMCTNSPARFDCALFDLGMSTDQIYGERGFSFQDECLDMRMNSEDPLTADVIVNEYSFAELKRVLARGGVTGQVSILVNAIINARPIKSARVLFDICERVNRSRRKNAPNNPASAVFQAIRIEVNGEFDELRAVLDYLPERMATDGLVMFICFHSLEDRIVTAKLREMREDRFRFDEPRPPLGKLLTPKGIKPTLEEVAENSASRSAILRAFKFF